MALERRGVDLAGAMGDTLATGEDTFGLYADTPQDVDSAIEAAHTAFPDLTEHPRGLGLQADDLGIGVRSWPTPPRRGAR
ncbi:hypothetical protein ACIRPX_42030 [Streptomyces sp. NPDC101225]|uniref:hypothetical protein n=1 Tax=Streptomyces sp. NPDC101225 TaxID=3366135 RepID=UPI00381E2058